MLRIIHTGTGTTPVDSGLPHVGRIFGIDEQGTLRWYRYHGRGHQDPTGSPPHWDPRSGNPIGRGFQSFLHVVGCGDGALMGIEPNGDLRWYRYKGDGSPDPTGSLRSWDSNSGNTIGNGFQHFVHVFAKPRAGREATAHVSLFCVERNGDLRWYGYRGNGEHDPSGHLGWMSNSGNVVGNGWASFQQIVGANVIFGIAPNGDLRWYAYHGLGEQDPSGVLGWAANSGNKVGRGWQNFRLLTGGADDNGPFITALFAVRPNGDLLWYGYGGSGKTTEDGTLGWVKNSSNQIGRGF